MIGSLKVLRITSIITSLALCVLMGCGIGNQPNPLTVDMESPPERVLDGCERAQRKCTVCHTVERILHSKIPSPSSWRKYVRRMRRMPGGGISAEDETRIVDCLVFRSFGIPGLMELKEAAQ